MASREDILIAKETFLFEEDGDPKMIRKGATVRAGHPILVGREDMFAPLVVDFEVEIKPRSKAYASK